MTDTVWRWWPNGKQVVQVLAEQHLFGQTTLDVYAPAEGRVHAVGAGDVLDLRYRHWTPQELPTRALALRVLSEAQSGHPIAAGTRVELLPHQVAILQRALRLSPVRLAICCEVGLGKTTTAGAIATELVARGRISRILVVAPKGVQLQWVAEMHDKFGLDFTRIGPEGVPIDAGAAVWRAFDLAVTSLDAIKPLRRRSGWTQQQLDAYNAARVRGASSAGWDLVIIDEAHHVAGSSVEVARHQLALDISANTENLLLLTATPHSGKSESFRRFLGLIDDGFRHGRDINASTVADVVARSDKRTAVDHAGKPLFHPRTTQLEIVPWDGHPLHRELYDALTEYVRDGYLSARSAGDTARSFLMLLFQRLVASSTAAIVAALEKRLETLEHTSDIESNQVTWDELDDDESELLLSRPSTSAELADLGRLVNLARHTLSAETDPKTVHFLRLLRSLQRYEHDPEVKILVFTQFRATQRAIVKVLEAQGIHTATVDGTMGLAERAEAQAAFRNSAQVLISTDAGGEGVNLQFAHLVVNWDLPWTPTLLEQRIGRVDRIGQRVPVRAFNFALADSVDQRVLEVLGGKLALILQELGVDKRGDVLATADALTDDLYITAIVDPDALGDAGNAFLTSARSELEATAEERALLTDVTIVPPWLTPSPIPALIERLNAQTDGGANAALRRTAIVVPGEPVPAVELEAGTGWLAIARVATGDSNGAVAAFAVFLPDGGRPDPRRGRALLDKLANVPLIALPTVPLPADVHVTLSQTLTDFGYQHLRDIGAGQVPKLPSLRLALVVRCP